MARVTDDGRIEIDAGIAPIGQGMQTVAARLAADTLGLDPIHVVAATPDTGRFRSCSGQLRLPISIAGRLLCGPGGRTSCSINSSTKPATGLEAAADDIELHPDATLRVRGTPSASIPLADLAGTEANCCF